MARWGAVVDSIDRQILDRIQAEFPLTKRPYATLAEMLGITEEEAFAHVSRLRKEGVIRQLSANFWAGKLGYVSTLCGANVPHPKLDAFIALVNQSPYVTHNYLRNHTYNVWFTVISPSREKTQAFLDSVTEKTGVAILNLPATKIFKINVNFAMAKP